MHIIITPSSGLPIYEQIKEQIRAQIASGQIPANSLLPSIRYLAKELQVGVITVKRAYDDLCAEGWCYAVQGKGVYSSPADSTQAENKITQELSARLREVSDFARKSGVSQDKLIAILKAILEEDNG